MSTCSKPHHTCRKPCERCKGVGCRIARGGDWGDSEDCRACDGVGQLECDESECPDGCADIVCTCDAETVLRLTYAGGSFVTLPCRIGDDGEDYGALVIDDCGDRIVIGCEDPPVAESNTWRGLLKNLVNQFGSFVEAEVITK
jgi:hypothetical protein